MHVTDTNFPTPSKRELDSHYGYIYRITNDLTGRIYIGKRKHDAHDSWRSYLGSGWNLKKEQEHFGREHFSKVLVEWVGSEDEAVFKESYWISEAVRSGVPHYNISNDASIFSVTPSEQRSILAFRYSFQSLTSIKAQRAVLRGIIETSPQARDVVTFQLHLDALDEAQRLLTERVSIKQRLGGF